MAETNNQTKDGINMSIRIASGRQFFWQWDLGQKLIVEDDGTCNEVHFCNVASELALRVSIKEQDGLRVADVPNILLQKSSAITAYLYHYAPDGSETRYAYHFPVRARPKPEGYVYNETEVLNYSSLDKRIAALEGVDTQELLVKKLQKSPISIYRMTTPFTCRPANGM